MPAAFSSKDEAFMARDPNLQFEMTRSGDEFFVTAVRKTPKGEQRTSSRIDLVYGAGAGTDEVYLTWRGDELYELPVAWLPEHQAWGASAFALPGVEERARELTVRCLDCHNTWFEHVPGTLNRYKREAAILGVTCEKCHGPAGDHVAFHEAHPDAQSGEAIVSPARLSRERQIDLCAQCHSNAITYRGPAFSYLPGEPLDAHFRTISAKHPEEDHVANQVAYLRESKCFKSSETLTCTTCHNPHRPRNAGPEAARSACLTCHQAADCGKLQRLPPAVRDNCVGCHMPVSKKVQVFFRTQDEDFVPPVNRWEHRIGIYPAAEQALLLAWHRTQDDDRSRREVDRLTAALAEHWLAEGDRCRREHRLLTAIYAYRQALQLNPAPETRLKLDEVVDNRRKFAYDFAAANRLMAEKKMSDAIVQFQNVLKIIPEFAKAHGRLGTAYAATGQKELAVEHLQAAAKYDPDDLYAPSMLGWLAYLEGRPEDALEHYRRAEEIEPYNAQVNYQLGLTLSSFPRWPEAEKRFRQALEIDPNHAGACQGLSHALRQQGQTDEALRFALRAARLTQFQHLDILITLADSYAAANRPQEAGKAASKALAASQAGKAHLAPEIRLRMELMQDLAKRLRKSGD
ncbi:MAG TPA: tetratricopeptide repeat protein [Pirellulales bacterium]|nr:tetratricopeptide repeat protein [Pirellulales bacterium]